MSEKRFKKMRRLAFHVEYGANYPAMARSQKKLEAMDITPRQWRRLEKMNDRKLQRWKDQERRWLEAKATL